MSCQMQWAQPQAPNCRNPQHPTSAAAMYLERIEHEGLSPPSGGPGALERLGVETEWNTREKRQQTEIKFLIAPCHLSHHRVCLPDREIPRGQGSGTSSLCQSSPRSCRVLAGYVAKIFFSIPDLVFFGILERMSPSHQSDC